MEEKNLYAVLEEEISKLSVSGWDAKFTGVSLPEAGNLKEWWEKNITQLRRGVVDLLIARANGSGNYAVNCDTLKISTSPVKGGVKCVVTRMRNYDNGYTDYSGRYQSNCEKIILTFISSDYRQQYYSNDNGSKSVECTIKNNHMVITEWDHRSRGGIGLSQWDPKTLYSGPATLEAFEDIFMWEINQMCYYEEAEKFAAKFFK